MSFFSHAAGAAAFLVVAIGPAMATPTTLAQYVQTNGALQEWTVSTAGTMTTVSASGAVFFSFSGVSGLPFSGPESANFQLMATSNQTGNCGVNCGPGDSYVQPGYTGTFSFTDTGSAPGANLLSGTFAVTGSPSTTGAQFSSSIGSSGGSFNASSTAGNLGQLVLTSAYLDFSGGTNENASFSLSSLIPNFATGTVSGNRAYPTNGPFNASGSGTFSSSPAPVSAPVAPIPEPISAAVLSVGFAGLSIVRRQRQAKDRQPSQIMTY